MNIYSMMKPFYQKHLSFFLFCAISILPASSQVMFDDFTYSDASDPAITTFNKWEIVNGTDGPPDGATYKKGNIKFITDPQNAANTLMTLQTTINGATDAITHARIQTHGYDYFQGTYAARVYCTDLPYTYKDANIQTFYTIVDYTLAGNGSKYSELDFEYMASDKWGISDNNKVLYLTAWNRYVADPWQAWKRYFSYKKSYEGWHTFIVSCTDGVNVKYWIDGVYLGSMATTDNDGTSVYPRSPMQIAFANWVWNSVIGNSTDTRNSTMQVDWVLFNKTTELTVAQVDEAITGYRTKGIQRKNLAGETYTTPLTTGLSDPKNDESFILYPNPASSVLMLQTNMDLPEDMNYSIYDVTGKQQLSGLVDAKQINVEALSAGLYYITFTANGNSVYRFEKK